MRSSSVFVAHSLGDRSGGKDDRKTLLEPEIRDAHHQVVRCIAICLQDQRPLFHAACRELFRKLFHANLVVPEVDCWHWSGRDAYDFRVLLRSESKGRERERNGDARLQYKTRTQRKKRKNEKEHIDNRQYVEECRMKLDRARELHR